MFLKRCCSILSLFFLLLLPGCLISTQSFNHGKLLNPGERMGTVGAGWKNSTRYFKNFDYTWDSTTRRDIVTVTGDSTRLDWLNVVWNYRAGVLNKYPFGEGLEIGYHMESSFTWQTRIDTTYSYYYNFNDSYNPSTEYELDTSVSFEGFSPPLLEIEARFGLPGRVLSKSIFHHNVALGWITGQYVDNGWFIGYAAGWEFSRVLPFVNTKLMMTATDLINSTITDDVNLFTRHERTFVGRISAGASFLFPSNFSFIPEYITPELSVMYPNYSFAQPAGVSFTVGIRWLLGQ